MLNAETMKIVALVSEKLNPDNVFMAEDDVVLVDPPISVTVSRKPLSVKSSLFCHKKTFIAGNRTRSPSLPPQLHI